MKLLGKLVLIIAILWFVGSVYAIFWPSVTANIIETENISLGQNGYNGVSKPGTATFKGGSTKISLVSYQYSVDGVSFIGTGSLNVGNKNSFDVYYCPLYPAFSLTKNSIPLPWLLLLCLIGFGILEMNKWLQGILKRKL